MVIASLFRLMLGPGRGTERPSLWDPGGALVSWALSSEWELGHPLHVPQAKVRGRAEVCRLHRWKYPPSNLAPHPHPGAGIRATSGR